MEKERAGKRAWWFLGKVALFCLPLAVILGFPIWAMYRSGEFTPYNIISARRISGEPSLVGFAYSVPIDYLDMQAVLAKKPRVLVIGSSRVGSIRPDFFSSTTTEYTATGIAQEMDHFRQFLEKIPTSSTPQVLILGLDQKFFDPNYNSLEKAPHDIGPALSQPGTPIQTILSNWLVTWFEVYSYLAKKKITFGELVHPNPSLFGLESIADGLGYRDDGSYDPGDKAYTPPDQDANFSDIAQGIDGFEYSDAISQGALSELNALLDECKARHIYVVGFVPPFSPGIYADVVSMGSNYGYLDEITSDTAPLFQEHGFGFYNFGNPQSLGITESDMQDGIHLNEEGSLIMLERMFATDKTLAQYASLTLRTGSR